MEDYKTSPQYRIELEKLEGITRAKNPEQYVKRIIEINRGQPYEEEISRRAKDILREYNKLHGQGGKQGIEIICYGLDPQTCQVVFESEEKARKTIGSDFAQLNIRKNTYFLSDYAIYGQQARALAELMYQCLYEPSVFNSPLIHNKKMFDALSIWNTGIGEFSAKPKFGGRLEIKNIPPVKEMRECLREKGFFEEIHKKFGITPFVKLLNLVLDGKVQRPDEVLMNLVE